METIRALQLVREEDTSDKKKQREGAPTVGSSSTSRSSPP
jgi:hypothetical protein